MCPYTKTADGFEMHIGVNHLGENLTFCSNQYHCVGLYVFQRSLNFDQNSE